MNLRSRIAALEKAAADDGPRRVNVFYGVHFARSWIDRGVGWELRDLDFFVKVPHPDSSWSDYLTGEQRETLRRTDILAVFECINDGRDPDLPV